MSVSLNLDTHNTSCNTANAGASWHLRDRGSLKKKENIRWSARSLTSLGSHSQNTNVGTQSKGMNILGFLPFWFHCPVVSTVVVAAFAGACLWILCVFCCDLSDDVCVAVTAVIALVTAINLMFASLLQL